MTTTLMILAGCKGAGKSSLLDMAYRQNIALFGADCAALFQAHNPGRYPEQKIFIDALNWQTHFQGRHIPSLRELETLPPTVIIHLDLYRLLTAMAWRISEDGASLAHLKIRIPRNDTDLLNIGHNDALMENFMRSAFFRRFDAIHVNTLKPTFETCMKQFTSRDGAKLFQSDDATARRIYQELYNCWACHLDLLNPTQRLESFFSDGKLHIRPSARSHEVGRDRSI